MNNNLFEDKFKTFFDDVTDMSTTDKKTPSLVSLQNMYYSCNQKLSDFEQEYHDNYLDLYSVIEKNDIDMIKSKLSELQSFIKKNEIDINQCYKNIQDKQLIFMRSNNEDNHNLNNGIIKIIQEDTNDKYKKYQNELIVLKDYQNKLKKSIQEYNTVETNLNDGILERTYILFYIWFVITILIVSFTIINILDLKFGIVNNILLIITLLVSIYFIYINLNSILLKF